MNNTYKEILSLNELCEITLIPRNTIVQIIEHGIIEPLGSERESWQFDAGMLHTTRKALRLQRDLELDWPGIAFAISLIDELEQLREEIKCLNLRLSCSEIDSDQRRL